MWSSTAWRAGRFAWTSDSSAYRTTPVTAALGLGSSAGPRLPLGHPDLRGRPLPFERRDTGESGAHARYQRLVHRIPRMGEPVGRELQRRSRRDQSGAAQVSKVTRDGGLGQAQQGNEIAHAEFTGRQQVEDPDAGRVGE